ncbi:MAG: arsenate reductase ArsC, partial [Bacilli bacterium]
GINMDNYYPKLMKDIPEDINIVITMGCNVQCPYIPGSYTEDWGIEDPSGSPIEAFRKTRDLIIIKVNDLLLRIENGEFE